MLARVGASAKRFTICFLGAADMSMPGNARAAPTLRAAAEQAIGAPIAQPPDTAHIRPPRPGTILGLYSGGTLSAEAQLILLGAGRSVGLQRRRARRETARAERRTAPTASSISAPTNSPAGARTR